MGHEDRQVRFQHHGHTVCRRTYKPGHINQDLVKKWADNSGAVIDWYGDRLKERNVELMHESCDSADEARYRHFPTGHSPRWTGSDDGTGHMLDKNRVLCDYAISKGAEFHYNTGMIRLTQDDSGAVTGCIARNGRDELIRYTAVKGTVVCTGGFSLNLDMMEALQPWTLNITGRNHSAPGALGDGIKACLWAGAGMDETHASMLFDRCALRNDQMPGRQTLETGDNGFFPDGQPALAEGQQGRETFLQ